MKIIEMLDEIKAAQTVIFPTHDDVRMRFPQYTSGWVTAYYDHSKKQWMYGYHETREQAIQHYDNMKELARMFPELVNWFTVSEMYVYCSHEFCKPKWALMFSIVE